MLEQIVVNRNLQLFFTNSEASTEKRFGFWSGPSIWLSLDHIWQLTSLPSSYRTAELTRRLLPQDSGVSVVLGFLPSSQPTRLEQLGVLRSIFIEGKANQITDVVTITQTCAMSNEKVAPGSPNSTHFNSIHSPNFNPCSARCLPKTCHFFSWIKEWRKDTSPSVFHGSGPNVMPPMPLSKTSLLYFGPSSVCT